MGTCNSKVTVISAFHNRANLVERTLRSISEQTYTNLEVVVWDDCSSDATWSELCRVSEELNDSRFRVYRHEVNMGLTAGFNKAIHETSGEYIAVVGSGDVCDLSRIELQVEAMEQDPGAVFCACASLTVDEHTGKTFLDSKWNRRIITRSDIAFKVPFTHGTVLYRRSAVESSGAFNEIYKWCADWDLFYRLLRDGHAIYIPKVLYRRFALLDGVSFNPHKSYEQIHYKHLAHVLNSVEGAEREALVHAAKVDIHKALAGREDWIARDLWRREVKLRLMERRTQADELRAIYSQRYPTSTRNKVLAGFAGFLGKSPVRQDLLIKISRQLARALSPTRT